MKVTAPTVVNSTNGQEELTIYACSQKGIEAKCDGLFKEVASLTIAASVPEFGYGVAGVAAVGLVGLVLLKKRSSVEITGPAGTPV